MPEEESAAKESGEKLVFVRGAVPESVRARFKATCALQGRDMSGVIEGLIIKWLEEYETPPPPKKPTKRSKTQ